MLVYGDSKRSADPRALLRALVRDAERAAGDGERRTSLLLDAGELAQGLIDSELAATGVDEASPLAAAANALVLEVAEFVLAAGQRPLGSRAHALLALALPERVTISLPEGFAFYAVYPEAWARAAEGFRGARTRVLGIRSIGLTLGAMVAAAAGSEQFVSLRPTGHPFDRTVAIGPALASLLLADNGEVTYLVVDEGPGLSGSSLASVARWLGDHGVALERVVFMPSHGGEPGVHASDEVRRIWASVRRRVAPPPRVLERFAGGEDLSGNAWREALYGEHPWPPANTQQERHKHLLRVNGTQQLAKFVGLGRHGVEKLAFAQTLAAHGWTPQPLELTDGFLFSEWLDALPLDHPNARFDRAALLRRVGDYVVFRASNFSASDRPGASVELLLSMLCTNAEAALGPQARASFSRWERSLAALGVGLEPCKTDNRMHRWEWLVTPKGVLRKSDALDHHATHDLVGAQDPVWDLVGARHELGLRDSEFVALTDHVAQALGRRWTPSQIDFFSAAYLALQCGAASMAAATASEADAARLQREAQRYARALTKIAPSAR